MPIDTLKVDNTLDVSNNQIVTYKPKDNDKRSIRQIYYLLLTKFMQVVKIMEKNSSLFKYNTTDISRRPYIE